MILVTTEQVPGRAIAGLVGFVRGSSVRGCALPGDVEAGVQNLVGGEIAPYTKLFAEAREQALDRLVAQARAQGADAIVALRFCSSEIASGAAEILAYGTAVKLVAAPA